MKLTLRSLLLMMSAAFILASCGKKAPAEARFIPKDVSTVFVLNAEQLEEKLEKEKLSVDSIIRQAVGSDTASSDFRKYREFKDAGINWNSKLFVYMVQKGSIQKGQTSVINVLASLKDADKFEAYLKKQDEFKDKEFKKEKDYTYVSTSSTSVMSWTNKNVIFTLYQDQAKPQYDTVTHTFQYPDRSLAKADMLKEVARYHTQKESESVASIDAFNDMFKEKADGYMFGTSNTLLAYLSAMPISIPKLQDLLKDNYSVSTFNFEEGKIVMKGATFTNPTLSNILKKYAGPTVNTSLIEHFPSQNVNGFLLAAFNPEIFTGVLKELEIETLVNTYLMQVGINAQDVFKSLKGDIAIGVGDFSFVSTMKKVEVIPGQPPVEYPSTTASVKLIINAPIGDKAAFYKILDKAVEKNLLVKENGTYAIADPEAKKSVFLHVDDKNFVIASDSATYAAYVANTTKANIPADVMSQVKGKATAAYVDLDKLIAAVEPMAKGLTGQDVYTTIHNTFKDAMLTSDNFDGKSLKSEAVIRMKDEKKNSLVTLYNMVSDIVKTLKVRSTAASAPMQLNNEHALQQVTVIR